MMSENLSPELIESVAHGYNSDPFSVLGPHATTYDGKPAYAVRVFLPWAETVTVATAEGSVYEAWRLHPEGFFEAVVPGDEQPAYLLRAVDKAGHEVALPDPYSFGPLLSDFDLHLIGEGSHYRT